MYDFEYIKDNSKKPEVETRETQRQSEIPERFKETQRNSRPINEAQRDSKREAESHHNIGIHLGPRYFYFMIYGGTKASHGNICLFISKLIFITEISNKFH